MKLLLLFAVLLLPLLGVEVHAVVPPSAPAPIGPYSPGIMAGDYLYVSGQGAHAPDGSMPDTFAGQVRQMLENVKAVVEAGGLTMEHVVYTQVYLEDMSKFAEMNAVYAQYFSKAPPARATLGVAKLPNTTVEMNAVAVRDLSQRKPVAVPGYDPREPVSPGILTQDRLYVSAMRGRDLRTGTVPDDPAAQVDAALDGVKAVLEAAGLQLAHMVFVNPYLTKQIPGRVMNKLYAARFEFGNTPARATIEVSSLPEGARIEYTGVAVRDLSQRRAVRPKNMRPSPTASPCVFAGDTLFCSAKDAFIPGPNAGVFATTIEHQVRQSMRNLLDNLEEAGMDFSTVVSTNVYLDDIADFQGMNRIYAKFFKTPFPARTTVQQIAPVGERKTDGEGEYPALEQVSLIAVKGVSGR
ncbi:MAG: RidA family protein [Bryobacteraceae bacterium]|jgi:reactive intermediate/imine deaminase